MMPIPIDSRTAPQLCRWLRFKDLPGLAPSNFTQATCVRVKEQPREVVPAYYCVGCRDWALRDDS
jgi:hypothetical protein